MAEFNLENIKHIHFVGIGGIGVSALARLFLHRGVAVTGSDTEHSQILENLGQEGIRVFVGHDPKNITDDTDLLVYSPAVPENNPERVWAKDAGVPEYSYPEVLGLLSKHPFTIAVSGTHGKTTTTAMIADILKDTEIRPTVIVGSLLSGTKSNFVAGSNDYFLVEACEYQRSFTHIHPNILVITNIDLDHLDYYKNLEDIQHAFNELVKKVPPEGFIVCDIKDERLQPALAGVRAGVVNYRSYISHDISLSVHGTHNRENAAAAEAVADILGIIEEHTHKMLGTFIGTWRRAEKKGKSKAGAEIYDDYAHHPTEVRATLKSFRDQFPDKQIIVVFQPHLYSRTKILMNDFADSFTDADEVLVIPVYAAREKDDGSISHEMLAEALEKAGTPARALSSHEEAVKELDKKMNTTDVVITMGAGDVFQVGEKLVQ